MTEVPSPGIVAFAIMPPVFLLVGNEPVWWPYWLLCTLSWYCLGAWAWGKWRSGLKRCRP